MMHNVSNGAASERACASPLPTFPCSECPPGISLNLLGGSGTRSQGFLVIACAWSHPSPPSPLPSLSSPCTRLRGWWSEPPACSWSCGSWGGRQPPPLPLVLLLVLLVVGGCAAPAARQVGGVMPARVCWRGSSGWRLPMWDW